MAAAGSTPFAIRSNPRGPYSTIVDACVQTAPMPARTCGTARPTNGTRVVTVAPDCPVTGSIAHSENVEYCGSPSSLMVTPSAARCWANAEIDRADIITSEMKRRFISQSPGYFTYGSFGSGFMLQNEPVNREP